jgi:ABC-type glycerol-3-phosphate transport system permease component
MNAAETRAAAPAGAATIHRRSTRLTAVAAGLALNVLLVGLSAAALLPIAWMVSTSLKPAGTEYEWPIRWIPDRIVFENYVRAHTVMNFAVYYRNTITIAALSTLGATLTSTLAAYGFARLRFVGRDFWFVALLSTLMLPDIVTLIPTYVIFRTLKWIDTLYPLIVPSWLGGGAFFIFLARQFFMTIPFELDEAARIDGAGSFRIYWQIMLPLSGPVLAVVSTFTFVDKWTQFLTPLIYLNSDDVRTVALGIALNKGLYNVHMNYLMAGSVAMTVPIIVLFVSAQRYFMKGIVLTGLAGR